MEEQSDNRFDPNWAMQMLLDIAHVPSLEGLLQTVVARSIEHHSLSCVQIWLVNQGDLCSSCRFKRQCQDTNRCLHLMAGKGVPAAGGDTFADERAFDRRQRIPLGLGLLGNAGLAAHQDQHAVADMDSSMLVGLDWVRQGAIRTVSAMPIIFRGEVLGVIAVFLTRKDLPEEGRPWGQIFADHIGAVIANVRAFEEIQRLKSQLELQNTYLQEEVVEAKAFGDLVGRSAVLQQIVSQIDLVAPTEASVLVLGETGTGKELVAHEIHRRSLRKDGPLVRVNCASIPRELFESEFFGHSRGAFTGAVKDRAGRFEAAEGGTLLLDEIGEVPLEMQGKLLRILQEKRYERVGDDRTRHANVRIIAATNRDLKKAVAAGRFREDLYYRLNVFPIVVVPLRERRDDVLLLARHFIELSAKELRCAKPRLTRAAAAKLHDYDWPGNVRELRNVIERAVILARGGPLQFDLPASDLPPLAPAIGGPDVDGAATSFLTESEMLRRERQNLRAALAAAGWRVKGRGGAAELLGINPTTLLSRMQKMGLTRPRDAGK
jgi:transcriptional regulator with GAF, ATPase, and Fis domain